MRADQMFLTRRMFVIKSAVVAAFSLLIAKLAHMQVLKREVFAQQAEENRKDFEPITAPRGLIFDRAGRPLAENRRTWEVRVIPADLPDETEHVAEYQRVRETLINWLRLPEALVVNPAGVPVGSERTVYGRIAHLLGDSDEVDWWVDYITRQARINYLVMCDPELTADRAATFRAAAQELPGVEVVNIFDYRVKNIGDPRQPVVIKKDVSREVALKLLSNTIYLPGVELDDTSLARTYPAGDVMSHLLGYASGIQKEDLEDPENKTEGGTPLYLPDDIIGQAGLERSMEAMLRGQKGGRWVEVDTHGVQQRVLDENPAVPGKNLKLTIDLELQAAASQALQVGFRFSNEDRPAVDAQRRRPVREYKAGAGAVVVLDPRTGEVLAMVSHPTYDNRLFLEGISERKYKAYNDDEYQPLINKCVAQHYAPGSTLKLFIAASALREKVIDEGTTFTCTGAIRVPWDWDESKGSVYPCWLRDQGHGTLDVYGAIERSCDVFFYNAGTPRQQLEGKNDYLHYYDYNVESEHLGDIHYFGGLGIDKIKMNLTKRFWFGRTTGIDLPWEAPGLVPDPEWKWDNFGEGWSSGETIITSIGQGEFRCTPLQLALNTASLANGGRILRPLLVKEIVDDKKKSIQAFEPQLLRDMRLSRKYLNVVREGMRLVVHGEVGPATARANQDGSSKWRFTNPEGEEEITIAGKTGTAEFGTVNEETLEYEQQHAWFTCYAPYDDPEVVVTVIVEDGGDGSSYAVPVVDKVLRAYFELAGRRKRGTILREDKKPVGEDAPPPEGLLYMAEPGTLTPQFAD